MPAVLVFDREGNLLKSWGGQGHVPHWPKSEHALWVDEAGNVWIGGNAPGDRQVLKFTADGRQLLEIGYPTNARATMPTPAFWANRRASKSIALAHEVYISDGYLNKPGGGLRFRQRKFQARLGRLWHRLG